MLDVLFQHLCKEWDWIYIKKKRWCQYVFSLVESYIIFLLSFVVVLSYFLCRAMRVFIHDVECSLAFHFLHDDDDPRYLSSVVQPIFLYFWIILFFCMLAILLQFRFLSHNDFVFLFHHVRWFGEMRWYILTSAEIMFVHSFLLNTMFHIVTVSFHSFQSLSCRSCFFLCSYFCPILTFLFFCMSFFFLIFSCSCVLNFSPFWLVYMLFIHLLWEIHGPSTKYFPNDK